MNKSFLELPLLKVHTTYQKNRESTYELLVLKHSS